MAPIPPVTPPLNPLQSTQTATPPFSWTGNVASAQYRTGIDFGVTHKGSASAYIASGTAATSLTFGILTQTVRADAYHGKRVRLSGSLRPSNVTGNAALYLRADGPSGIESFDNMSDRLLRGTLDWTSVSLVVDIPNDAYGISFGAILGGAGVLHLDDLQLEIVETTVAVTGRSSQSGALGPGAPATVYAQARPQPLNLDFEAPIDQPPPAVPVSWLNANAVSIRSIDPADAGFSDLQALKTAIGSSRVVMLGEQSHGDGTTFLAKTRLIRFLHEDMGFDVLAFESGFFDVHEAWKRIQTGTPAVTAARSSIFGLWSYSEQVRPLFDYIGANAHAARPLVLLGMDCQFTGTGVNGTGPTFITKLEAYLTSQGSTILSAPEWAAFGVIADSVAKRGYDDLAPSAAESAAFDAGSALLMRETVRLRDASPSAESSFWAQLAKSLDSQFHALWYSWADPTNTLAYDIVRDSGMARNIIWLANTAYAGSKIIVWAHAEHLQLNPEGVADIAGNKPFAGWANTGYLTKSALGDQVYSIGFLAGTGTAQRADAVPPPPITIGPPRAGSWDDVLLSLNKPYVFLDLRNPAPGGEWVKGPRIARPFFYAENYANWSTAFDAFVFTATMTPSVRNP
ncbi:MAG: erythromycin esterase family protein [bacterium]